MGSFDMNRRAFLAALGLGSAHLLFENPLYGSSPRFSSVDPLQRVRLGNSGLKTTLLGMGTGCHASGRSSALTRQDHQQSIALLSYAYDRGLRQFDAADSYGTHPLLAKAMKGMERDELTLVSKIWFSSGGIPEPERPDANVVLERFLRELETDYIDLVQIHCMVEKGWTSAMRRQMDILEELKAKGKIRAHGVSVHSLEAMKEAVEEPWVDVIHTRINPYGLVMDSKDPEEVVKVIHDLHAVGKGVIGMKLVGNGMLEDDSDKIDHSLRFVLGLGSVDQLIVGFEHAWQIDNYLDRMSTVLKEMHGV